MYSSNIAALIFVSFILHGHSAPAPSKSDAVETTQGPTNGENKIEAVKQDAAPRTKSHRQNKALNLFSFLSPILSSGLDYTDDVDEVTFGVSDDAIEDNELSRTIPSRPQNKNNGGYNRLPNDENINSLHYDNSPIFYVRLPPTPYMFVPGLGYVSHPPSLGPPMPPPVADPFINIPLDFVSNGKPTGIYQWNVPPGFPDPQMGMQFGYGPQPIMPMNQPSYNGMSFNNVKPTQSNSKVTNLKGQFVFNGKPGDRVNVLRDTYNSIYTDALQNFYP